MQNRGAKWLREVLFLCSSQSLVGPIKTKRPSKHQQPPIKGDNPCRAVTDQQSASFITRPAVGSLSIPYSNLLPRKQSSNQKPNL